MAAPDRDDYYLALAYTVATRAECGRRRGGAVLVSDDRVIATGYTGVPEDLRSHETGCRRCRTGEADAAAHDAVAHDAVAHDAAAHDAAAHDAAAHADGDSVGDDDPGCDVTMCMPADMAALMSAARHGASTAGAVLYCTDQPDFPSSKALVQAGVARVVFARTWHPDDRVVDDHRRLQQRLGATHVPTEYEIQVLE